MITILLNGMAPVVLIVFFYFFFVWVLSRWSKKYPGALSTKEIAFAFGLKILSGILYGYIFLVLYKGDDTWYFHNGSLEEKEKLLNHPFQFFADFNPIPAFERNESFAQGWYYYLSDLEFWLLSKPMAIVNLISHGNYYVNLVFFNFIVFWGQLWLFQLYLFQFPSKRTILFIAIFCIPFLLFWLSGIRGDGYLLFFMGLLVLHFYKWISGGSNRSWIYIFIGIAGLVIFRSVLLLLLIPCLLSWWISIRFQKKIFSAAAFVYGICIIIFFGSIFFSTSSNLPSIVVNRQKQFFALHGNSRYNLDTLQPSVSSFLSILPQSINNTVFRPYIWEARGLVQIAAALETLIVFFLALLFVFRNRTSVKEAFSHPLLFFPFLFSITLYLFIGYSIPFPGAIIRYKVPGEFFLIILFLIGIDWKKIVKLK